MSSFGDVQIAMSKGTLLSSWALPWLSDFLSQTYIKKIKTEV